MKRILIAVAFLAASTAAIADVYRPSGNNVTVTSNPYSSTAASTLPGSYITVLRVVSTVDVFANVGVTPNASASTTGFFVPAYTPEYFSLGSGEQLAVISSSATGTVYISDMTK